MKAKVVFVSSTIEPYPLSLRLLQSYAFLNPRLREGCEFVSKSLYGLPETVPAAHRAAREILALEPRLVAFSLYMWNSTHLLRTAALLRQLSPKLPVVVGGPETAGEARPLLGARPAIDVVVEGEGEIGFRQVLEHFLLGEGSLESATGVSFRRGQELCLGAKPGAVAHLDELPSPVLGYSKEQLLTQFDAGVFIFQGNRRGEPDTLLFESSRGCPLHCSYCLYGKGLDTIRSFSLERVTAELEYIRGLGVPSVNFLFCDSVFVTDKRRNRALLEYFLNTFTTAKLHVEMKLDAVTEELLPLYRDLFAQGRLSFGVGLQTTNPKALSLVGRPTNLPRLSRTISQLAEAKPESTVMRIDLLGGLPGDTFEGVLRSLDWAVPFSGIGGSLSGNIVFCLPGTRYRSEALEHGIVFDPDPPYAVVETATCDSADIRRIRFLFESVAAFQEVFTLLFGARGLKLPHLFSEAFAKNRFEILPGPGGRTSFERYVHFARGVLSYLVGNVSQAEAALIQEAFDARLAMLTVEEPGADWTLLRKLPSAVRNPLGRAAKETSKARSNKGPRFALSEGAALAAVLRFRHDLASYRRGVPRKETSYVVVGPEKHVVLSPELLRLLGRLTTPKTAEEARRSLKLEASEAGRFLAELAQDGFLVERRRA